VCPTNGFLMLLFFCGLWARCFFRLSDKLVFGWLSGTGFGFGLGCVSGRLQKIADVARSSGEVRVEQVFARAGRAVGKHC
jgi:hypothetical protein